MSASGHRTWLRPKHPVGKVKQSSSISITETENGVRTTSLSQDVNQEIAGARAGKPKKIRKSGVLTNSNFDRVCCLCFLQEWREREAGRDGDAGGRAQQQQHHPTPLINGWTSILVGERLLTQSAKRRLFTWTLAQTPPISVPQGPPRWVGSN